MGMSEAELGALGLPSMPTIGAGNARQPLGPPQGFYTEQAMVNPALAGFQPYVSGDEWVPAYNLSPADRDRLKARMNAAGLYGTSGYASGTWTQEDANAYQAVLESANGMGVRDAEVVIDNLAESAKRGPRVAGPRAPLVSRVSNPDDIRSVLRKAAYDLTGSRLSDEEEQRLISTYQGQQSAASQAEYAAGGAAPGSSTAVTQEAGMQTFAEAQIESMRPGDVAAHRHLDAFERILGSLGPMVAPTENYTGQGLPNAGSQEVL